MRLGEYTYVILSVSIFFPMIYGCRVYICFCFFFCARGDRIVYVSIRIYYECVYSVAPYIWIDGFRFDCTTIHQTHRSVKTTKSILLYGGGGGFRVYVSNLANDRLPYIIFNSANVADERPLKYI